MGRVCAELATAKIPENIMTEETLYAAKRIRVGLLLFGTLVLLAVILTKAAQKNRTLVISGYPGEIAVTETDGHSYVEIAALAQLTNGSLSFNGNQILLTWPGVATPSVAPAAHQPPVSGFSKDFIRAAIEQMEVIREWRGTVKNAIAQGFPVTENWADNYRARAEQSLRLVSLAVSTDHDRGALQLLTNEFNNMKKLSERFVEIGKRRAYVSPRALDDDPLDQKILKCAHSLAAMAANGQFVDDGSCH